MAQAHLDARRNGSHQGSRMKQTRIEEVQAAQDPIQSDDESTLEAAQPTSWQEHLRQVEKQFPGMAGEALLNPVATTDAEILRYLGQIMRKVESRRIRGKQVTKRTDNPVSLYPQAWRRDPVTREPIESLPHTMHLYKKTEEPGEDGKKPRNAGRLYFAAFEDETSEDGVTARKLVDFVWLTDTLWFRYGQHAKFLPSVCEYLTRGPQKLVPMPAVLKNVFCQPWSEKQAISDLLC